MSEPTPDREPGAKKMNEREALYEIMRVASYLPRGFIRDRIENAASARLRTLRITESESVPAEPSDA